jgi:hypothetical protein
MASLPASTNSLLVRTYFGSPDAWLGAVAAATAENVDGFHAYVEIVNDPAWDGAGVDDLRTAVLAGKHASVLFVVDEAASEGDFPIQVVDLSPERRTPFRCVARELWGVDNNLNLANMDWEEFASTTDVDGIHRGFGQ